MTRDKGIYPFSKIFNISINTEEHFFLFFFRGHFAVFIGKNATVAGIDGININDVSHI